MMNMSPGINPFLHDPAALCISIRQVAVEAGKDTLLYFQEGGCAFESKNDGSPVTLADSAAEKIIYKGLLEIAPGIPCVGEEAASAGIIPDLSGTEWFWLVDPLDGTKEFIKGSGEYTVNIALIHKGVPVLGVVYAPAIDELYAGYGPGTAVCRLSGNNQDQAIQVRQPPAEGLTVVASRLHTDQDALDKFLGNLKVASVSMRGSSLKICEVAAGKADLYPRLGPTCEWDTAAGDAVLRSAGGEMIDMTGALLRYGHAERKFLNPEFLALSVEMRGFLPIAA